MKLNEGSTCLLSTNIVTFIWKWNDNVNKPVRSQRERNTSVNTCSWYFILNATNILIFCYKFLDSWFLTFCWTWLEPHFCIFLESIIFMRRLVIWFESNPLFDLTLNMKNFYAHSFEVCFCVKLHFHPAQMLYLHHYSP